jgi:hypothetical protein
MGFVSSSVYLVLFGSVVGDSNFFSIGLEIFISYVLVRTGSGGLIIGAPLIGTGPLAGPLIAGGPRIKGVGCCGLISGC